MEKSVSSLCTFFKPQLLFIEFFTSLLALAGSLPFLSASPSFFASFSPSFDASSFFTESSARNRHSRYIQFVFLHTLNRNIFTSEANVVPGAGVLGCVSAGVPVDGVFPGESGWAAALLFSSRSAIQGMDHWPLTCSNSWTWKGNETAHGQSFACNLQDGFFSYLIGEKST